MTLGELDFLIAMDNRYPGGKASAPDVLRNLYESLNGIVNNAVDLESLESLMKELAAPPEPKPRDHAALPAKKRKLNQRSFDRLTPEQREQLE